MCGTWHAQTKRVQGVAGLEFRVSGQRILEIRGLGLQRVNVYGDLGSRI